MFRILKWTFLNMDYVCPPLEKPRILSFDSQIPQCNVEGPVKIRSIDVRKIIGANNGPNNILNKNFNVY